jgi:hypothetical protein
MKCQSNVFLLICTGHPPSGFTSRLHRGKKQGNQNADDGNNNQKFNESKTTKTA